MKKGKIGVQMMMLKKKVEELGAYETLKQLHDLGFHSVEVSQIPMTAENVSEIKRASDDFNIAITATSAPLEPMTPGSEQETLRDNYEKIVADCKALNCNYIRIGMLPFTIMGDKDKIIAFIDRAEEMAKRLKDEGISLYYHTHHIEFQRYDGKFLLDMMKENTSVLGFELDVHWIHRAGVDPVSFIKEYKNRVSLIHLKDYRIGDLDITDEDLKDMSNFFSKFTNLIEFAEVGEGNLNMPAIMEAGLEAGAEHFLIEQDDTYGRDPFDCLRDSAENLRKMGYADWF
ncbi:sugar phosphate isomerase/epimerase family protein [Saliterribacillus persicus]|uniref:Sugar phosphate isomerase/epimerase n=1 Tax=Saliterribacillus persicus TaxID=930114 RepID=A0A368Y9N0_9BACI|nr:sugar phosphate isomerase/epimerase [Saliterribacillus persicus]RCW74894.1 sugar phosphate isomerase/epimerase [Saliterribacillus persicus]